MTDPVVTPSSAPEPKNCRGHGGRHRGRGIVVRLLFAGVMFGVVAAGAYVGASHARPGMGGAHSMWHGEFNPETAARRIDAMVSFGLADIDATPEQKAKIGDIAKGALKDLAPLRDEHKASRAKAVELLSAASIDRAALEQVRASELKLAETASRRLTQALADAADTLQPAQRQKLVEKMQRRMERRG